MTDEIDQRDTLSECCEDEEEEIDVEEFLLCIAWPTKSVVTSLYLINADADDKYQTGSISTYAHQPWLWQLQQ